MWCIFLVYYLPCHPHSDKDNSILAIFEREEKHNEQITQRISLNDRKQKKKKVMSFLFVNFVGLWFLFVSMDGWVERGQSGGVGVLAFCFMKSAKAESFPRRC